jgi:dTDP-4-amino-4,6-dideoxygalactose transaminase
VSAQHCRKCGRRRPESLSDPGRDRKNCSNGVWCDWADNSELPLDQRVTALEQADLIARLERLERPVDSRDAIAWEIGHAAGARGDALHTNPFRKPERRGEL